VSDRRPATSALLVVAGLLVLVGVAVLAVRALGADDPSPTAPTGDLASALAATTPATAPFDGLTATQLSVGGRCLRTLIADSTDERVAGLRRRSDLGPYDAMLFVFPGPSETAFTMSTVPVPLEIGFYDGDGARSSARHMKPCRGSEATCPVYRSDGPFTYALETLQDQLPGGNLASCT
jgi:uncharacterized membrane protein (UPF0127 family)